MCFISQTNPFLFKLEGQYLDPHENKINIFAVQMNGTPARYTRQVIYCDLRRTNAAAAATAWIDMDV